MDFAPQLFIIPAQIWGFALNQDVWQTLLDSQTKHNKPLGVQQMTAGSPPDAWYC